MPIPTLTASDPKKKYELCPEGTYQAALIRAYYCGRHANKYNPANPPQAKLVLVFELDEPLSDGSGNHIMSTTVTYSLNEKSGLTKLLKPVMGSSYPDKPGQQLDISTLIDMRVMLTVGHETRGEKTYANIAALARVPRGMVPFNPASDSFVWSYDDPTDQRVPEWVRKFCSECIELGGPATAPQAQATKLDKQMADKFGATRVSGHAVNPDEDDAPF